MVKLCLEKFDQLTHPIANEDHRGLPFNFNYNMTVWILAENYISFTIAAGLIRLHMPGVKKYRV